MLSLHFYRPDAGRPWLLRAFPILKQAKPSRVTFCVTSLATDGVWRCARKKKNPQSPWGSRDFSWSWQCDSNTRPADYESAALPTELCQQAFDFSRPRCFLARQEGSGYFGWFVWCALHSSHRPNLGQFFHRQVHFFSMQRAFHSAVSGKVTTRLY